MLVTLVDCLCWDEMRFENTTSINGNPINSIALYTDGEILQRVKNSIAHSCIKPQLLSEVE